jgi:hypothetical protein
MWFSIPAELPVNVQVGYFVKVGDEKLIGIKVVVNGNKVILLPDGKIACFGMARFAEPEGKGLLPPQVKAVTNGLFGQVIGEDLYQGGFSHSEKQKRL